MKLGVVITMYDEYDLVLSSVKTIISKFPSSKIVVVQSEHPGQNIILQKISDKFIILPNLAPLLHKTAFAAHAVCRNISRGCSELLTLNTDFDLIAIFTGDTLITDASSFIRRYDEMNENNWSAMVSQAIGQRFHAATDNPPFGIVEGRYQNFDTTDFACCFFLINGKILQENRAFCNIQITNQWTSEQCLGDEMIRVIGGNSHLFHNKVGILNKNNKMIAYSYNDGIVYHAKTGKPGR